MFTTIAGAHLFIALLDLTRVARRLEVVEGMDVNSIRKAEAEYRQFLLIAWQRELEFRDHPEEHLPIVPGKLADEMWHAHILHTKDYHEMCMKLLGVFLHHSPDPDRVTSGNPKNIQNTARFDRAVPPEYRFSDAPLIKRESATYAGCGGPCNSCSD